MSRRRPRAILYIDGFNLYNGLVRRAAAKGAPTTEHRWLNLSKLGDFLMPEAEVVLVRYFTSRVRRRVEDPDAGLRQEVFLRALATLPNLTCHFGVFQRNKVRRRLVDDPTQSVRVVDFKEKGSDVNLATYLVHDALSGRCQMAGVMSSDSDLVVPIALARQALPKGVIVFSPNVGKPTRVLHDVATESRRIKNRALAACHLPDQIEDQSGVIHKPPEW